MDNNGTLEWSARKHIEGPGGDTDRPAFAGIRQAARPTARYKASF